MAEESAPGTEEASEEKREEEAVRVEVRTRARRRRHRPLLWPLLLVTVGVLWLLANLDVISASNLSVLLRMWPVVLIVIGLDILVGRTSRLLSGLLALVAMAAVVALVLFGPALGLAGEETNLFFGVPIIIDGDGEVKHDTFSAPVGDATSADVNLDFSFEPATVSALSGSDDLIDADLTYIGEIIFEASGDRSKRVTLRKVDMVFDGFNLNMAGEPLQWDVGLSPSVPMDLNVDVGSGSATLDLSELTLTDLRVDGGSGRVDLELPNTGEGYEVDVDVGSGPFDVVVFRGADVAMEVDGGSGPFSLDVGQDADLEMSIDAGSGPFNLDVPQQAAVRLEVRDSGSGPVNVPGNMTLVDRLDEDEPKEGIWETEDFDDAAHQIIITVTSAGSGPITVR